MNANRKKTATFVVGKDDSIQTSVRNTSLAPSTSENVGAVRHVSQIHNRRVLVNVDNQLALKSSHQIGL